MVKSKKFEYIVHATLTTGEECQCHENSVNDAMLQAASMGKRGCVVHKIVAIVTTVEESVVIDMDELRGE